MSRGRTAKGRARATRASMAPPVGRPLLRGVDHGEPIRVRGADLGQRDERWVDPFLEANAPLLRRLALTPEVCTRGGLHVLLKPGARIGAVPLLSPTTRRVVAGLLVEPRFRWAALGGVVSAIGFRVEPALGGAPPVPGSAREVPPWLLAGPVLNRLEALLVHQRRGFVERWEERASPRGRVEWTRWARHAVPAGRWQALPCVFSEPDADPDLLAAARWTLARLDEDLARVADTPVGRLLRARGAELAHRAGPGPARRPDGGTLPAASAWVAEALEAMGWVAEERGLGGARSLDGLAWDLPVDAVWESWVDAFLADLAPRLGLVARPGVRHRLNWHGALESMGALVPDVVLDGPGRALRVDAKYKAHLALLARHGWRGLSEAVRDAHRADLHQALAYAALAEVDRVDTVLVYPHLGETADHAPTAVATVAAGRRRVRLLLAGIPFGFRGPGQRDRTLRQWRRLLAA